MVSPPRSPIYMDHQATSPVDERVLARMLPFFSEHYGNAASRSHAFGWRAEEAVEAARGHIARLIGAEAREIIFTSGATEANNLAILGVAATHGATSEKSGKHIVTQATEHLAVLDPCRHLERQGFDVTVLPVDAYGRVDPAAVAAALRQETVLVTIMAANNEIGTLQPIGEIGALCHEAGVLFHTDAAQSAGKVPVDVQEMNLDLVSLSGHKMYGPKGVGALFVRRKAPRVRLQPLLFGGGHERGLRSGTLNVPAIVGFGEAARIASAEMAEEAERLAGLRDRLYQAMAAELPGLIVNGHPTERLSGSLNLIFPGVEGEALLLALREVAISSGAACTSATLQPSHVMHAIGVADEAAHRALRFGLGRFTTAEEVDQVAQQVVENVLRLRSVGVSSFKASQSGRK